jgi:large subunit ribosomal protein L18
MIKDKKDRRRMRHLRFSRQLPPPGKKPRLLVRKSLKYIYALLIDDLKKKVILTVSSASPSVVHDLKKKGSGKNIAAAGLVGRAIAEAALKAGYREVIFDRGGYLYHGKVKALADTARAAGLKF